MACVKLTFIKYKGRAEFIRFLLAQASVNYEDVRLEVEEWAEKMKGDAFTKPILEYDGTTICGNTAISKFVAEKHGLAGENEEMRQAAYEIVELTEGIWDKLSSCFWERDEEKKETAKKELIGVLLPKLLKDLESRAAKNKANGWMVGSNVTYADLAVAVLLEVLSQQKPELLAAFTNLGRIKRSVEDLPNIKAWIAKRPASDL